MPSDSGRIGQLCFRDSKCGQHRSHIGLAVLRAPTKRDLQGGLIGKPTPIFAGAALFLFLAAVFRATLLWGYFPAEFEPLELGTRTVGFILLFVFAYSYARAWTDTRNK
jgi:hypothetical protein